MLGLDLESCPDLKFGENALITVTYGLLAGRGEEAKSRSDENWVSCPGNRSGLHVRSDSRLVIAGDSGLPLERLGYPGRSLLRNHTSRGLGIFDALAAAARP